MIPDPAFFRRNLLAWYDTARRDLPWRDTTDPWRILVSEIMLQQTRATAVIPYYDRFLARFPDAAATAKASEQDILAAWSGLGYYSRARNLKRAARDVAGAFPRDYASIRQLPGVGPYTAAAVASIAFGLPHAAVDGNVLRVIARVSADYSDIASPATRSRFCGIDQTLLDPIRPGDFNQAMMELGATICLPRNPACLLCPVSDACSARAEGRQHELPVKRPKSAPEPAAMNVVIVRRGSHVLFRQRAPDASRMADFWELPEPGDLPGLRDLRSAGVFRHTIVNTAYTVRVIEASITRRPAGMRWFDAAGMSQLPLTTISRKALKLLYPQLIQR